MTPDELRAAVTLGMVGYRERAIGRWQRQVRWALSVAI
jgi:hypothetical protein